MNINKLRYNIRMLLLRCGLVDWSIYDAVSVTRYRTAEGIWGRIDLLSSYVPGSARFSLPVLVPGLHYIYRIRVWDHGRLVESRPLSQADYDKLCIDLRNPSVYEDG
jgi:hypothetical protein